MAKRRSQLTRQPLSSEAKRMAQWRSCGLVVLAAVVVLALAVAVRYFSAKPVAEGDHPHADAPHGGVIVPLGDKGRHYHVEVLRETGGFLRLYLLDGDAAQVREIDLQAPTAHIRSENGAAEATLLLMPAPQPEDAKGKTSQFFGKLAPALWGERLAVRVLDLSVAAKKYAFDFTVPGGPDTGRAALADRLDREETIFRTPSGKYTQDDIQVNGERSAYQKYPQYRTEHDPNPRPGDRICPVTKMKANRDCTWVVGGVSHAFCCPPCIEEFVKRAKGQ